MTKTKKAAEAVIKAIDAMADAYTDDCYPFDGSQPKMTHFDDRWVLTQIAESKKAMFAVLGYLAHRASVEEDRDHG